jgi:predicted enzyme related to lactoylglutathione lyase
MARVIGLGGVFFRARDPKALGDWYQTWLGMPVEAPYGAALDPSVLPKGSFQAWAPFPDDTTYFQPSEQSFMINLMVDDLEGVLGRVREGGGTQVGEIQEESYGRFAWFLDPEGNKVELWEPAKSTGSDADG